MASSRFKLKPQRKRGFTLLEIMIVVAIIGILAAIGLPSFRRYNCRSKQVEARSKLKAVYVAEQSYRALYAEYIGGEGGSDQLKAAGFDPMGKKHRYRITVDVYKDPTPRFVAVADGLDFMVNDVWEITQTNHLIHLTAAPDCM